MYHIQDWAGNAKFDDRTFATVNDAYDYLTQHLRTQNPTLTDDQFDTEMGEYYIVPVQPD
jgi:hypothetical protein